MQEFKQTQMKKLLLISFSGRTKQMFFLVIKLEPRLSAWLQPRKNNCVPTELDISIWAIVYQLFPSILHYKFLVISVSQSCIEINLIFFSLVHQTGHWTLLLKENAKLLKPFHLSCQNLKWQKISICKCENFNHLIWKKMSTKVLFIDRYT